MALESPLLSRQCTDPTPRAACSSQYKQVVVVVAAATAVVLVVLRQDFDMQPMAGNPPYLSFLSSQIKGIYNNI